MPQDTIGCSEPITKTLLDSDSKRTLPMIRAVAWLATLIVGFVQAWALRFNIAPDGNSYLDIAAYYLRGDYEHAINAYWSPMFSWLIAVVIRIFHVSGYWESTALHLLNFVGLLIALRSFEFFFSGFLPFLEKSGNWQTESPLQRAGLLSLGYGLFFSTMLYVLTMEPTTPDVWVCVMSFLAVGILVRSAVRPESWQYFVALGLVLGIAYLTKSFYFPLSFVFLACAYFTGRESRRRLARATVALLIFVLVSGPFIAALSRAKQRFTFGDVGKIAYAMFVDPIDQIAFWHGENHSGNPKHPTREVLSAPRVFEFGSPVGGSYPPIYDLSYWADGVQAHFSIAGQVRILRQSIGTFFVILLVQSEFAVGFLTLLILKGQFRETLRSIAGIWPLWLAPLAGCIAYSLVLTETRYVAPFIVFLWLALFAAVVSVPSGISKRVANAVVLAMLLFTAIKTAKYFVSDLTAVRMTRNVNWDVAQDLRHRGLQPGDRVAIIAAKASAHWARLAHLEVVAELPLGQDGIFWSGDDATQQRVFDAFRKTGARAVLVKEPPAGAVKSGWSEIGDTSYYFHELSAESGVSPPAPN